mgnify:CR=1
GFYVQQDIGIKVKTWIPAQVQRANSCELRESAGSSSGPYREDEGGRHILKTKRDVGPVDPGSSAYREDEGVLHTGMQKGALDLDPGSMAYREDEGGRHTGMTVILYLRGLWPHFTAKRSKQILRSVLQLQILRSLEAANSPTLPLSPHNRLTTV